MLVILPVIIPAKWFRRESETIFLPETHSIHCLTPNLSNYRILTKFFIKDLHQRSHRRSYGRSIAAQTSIIHHNTSHECSNKMLIQKLIFLKTALIYWPDNVWNIMTVIPFINSHNIGWDAITFGWVSNDDLLGTCLNVFSCSATIKKFPWCLSTLMFKPLDMDKNNWILSNINDMKLEGLRT